MERGDPVVVGRRVTVVKAERARELRRRLTPAERTLWERLRDGRLDGLGFRRQQIIDGFIVDFYCHAASVVIEVDGPAHAMHADYDAERDQALSRRGLSTLRVTNDDVRYRLDETLAQIAAFCHARLAANRPPPSPKLPPPATHSQ